MLELAANQAAAEPDGANDAPAQLAFRPGPGPGGRGQQPNTQHNVNKGNKEFRNIGGLHRTRIDRALWPEIPKTLMKQTGKV